MHIISGLKKRCLAPSTAPAAATGEAPTVSAAKKPTGNEGDVVWNRVRRYLLLLLNGNFC